MARRRRNRTIMVVDIGTSAIRATIAEYYRRQLTILEDINAPIDLSDGLRGGSLDRDTLDQVERILVDMRESAASYGIKELRIVGTTSLREAVNSDALVERLWARHQIQINVIDSAEEARIYYEGLRALAKQHKHKLNGTNVLLDIGGGATSTSLIRGGHLIYTADEPFGTMRVLDLFSGLSSHEDWLNSIERFTHGAVKMILRRINQKQLNTVYVNGPEVRQIGSFIGADLQQPFIRIEADTFLTWMEKMEAISLQECAALWQLSEEDALPIVPSAYLLRHLLQEADIDHFVIPRMHLRDGLLADSTPGSHGPQFLGRRELLAAARQMSSRYGMDTNYAENTASLAAQIFDQTRDLHHLGERDRTLLEFAAWVHDIGAFVNVHNRHLHTRYIVDHAVIAGLTSLEQKTIAQVARYHRRDHPLPEHRDFYNLPRSVRVQVTYLASILRLAYALDVERAQRIREVTCEVHDRRLLLHVDRRQISLEKWSIQTRSDMFEEVFGLQVVAVPLAIGQG